MEQGASEHKATVAYILVYCMVVAGFCIIHIDKSKKAARVRTAFQRCEFWAYFNFLNTSHVAMPVESISESSRITRSLSDRLLMCRSPSDIGRRVLACADFM